MSAPTELVALADVWDHLNIPTGSQTIALGTKLQGFIDAATEFIQAKTGPILSASFAEIRNGGSPIIMLDNPPILTMGVVTEMIGSVAYVLTKVSLGDANIGPYSYSLDDARMGMITRRTSGGFASKFASGIANVSLTYTSGLDTGGGPAPADLRMAVLQDIAGLYGPSQLGSSPYNNEGSVGNTPINPIGLFPRVASILSATRMRAPSIG